MWVCSMWLRPFSIACLAGIYNVMHDKNIKAGRITKSMTFSQKVWALTARVPRGKVTTYGEIARKLGCRGARAVGNAMNRNPYAPVVPCHRVVGKDGVLTGFSDGLARKNRMLLAEGIVLKGQQVDMRKSFMRL